MPLAVWMAIFIVAGIFSSLVWQLLNRGGSSTKNNRTSSSSSQSSKASQTRTNDRENSNLRGQTDFSSTNKRYSDTTSSNNSNVSDWEQRHSEDWEPTNVPNFTKDDDVSRQSPDTDIRRGVTDTNYAYKFKKDKESNSRIPWPRETSQGRSSKENTNSGSPKPPVSKNRDEVYDANYRKLNNVPPPSVPEDLEDEDPDWI